jgi:ABC-type sugar transport system permease subunit
VTLFAYYQGFQNFNLSYGATISLALLVFVTFLALTYLAATRILLRRIAT